MGFRTCHLPRAAILYGLPAVLCFASARCKHPVWHACSALLALHLSRATILDGMPAVHCLHGMPALLCCAIATCNPPGGLPAVLCLLCTCHVQPSWMVCLQCLACFALATCNHPGWSVCRALLALKICLQRAVALGSKLIRGTTVPLSCCTEMA